MANLKLSDDTFGILLPFVTDRQKEGIYQKLN